MNGILSNASDNKLLGVLCPKTNNNDSVETAGSLAMSFSLFDCNSYDEFYSNNPFIIDYSLYSDCGFEDSSSGFLSSFSNAYSELSSCGFSSGCESFSSCCSSGGFTSVC